MHDSKYVPQDFHGITSQALTRIQVPLNYSDPEGDAASIAVTRLPSPLAGTDDYKGPLLIIPGGPGGSGVELVLENGALLSQVLGPNFDFVSFDPRGSFHTLSLHETPFMTIHRQALGDLRLAHPSSIPRLRGGSSTRLSAS